MGRASALRLWEKDGEVHSLPSWDSGVSSSCRRSVGESQLRWHSRARQAAGHLVSTEHKAGPVFHSTISRLFTGPTFDHPRRRAASASGHGSNDARAAGDRKASFNSHTASLAAGPPAISRRASAGALGWRRVYRSGVQVGLTSLPGAGLRRR
jgi:hypothetical protein